MGLAEPRKRIKISNDPRNLTWTTSQNSFGHRLLHQQGWEDGQALGANSAKTKYADTDAAKVIIRVKDDSLGLGASLQSKDVANQRTGFDAFQGLLGRLNAKTEAERMAVEKKIEDKKLATFAFGRWGGMTFVPGGLLVQKDPYEQMIEIEKQKAGEEQAAVDAERVAEQVRAKADKKRRKAEKALRKEARRQKRTQKAAAEENGLPTPDISSSNEAEGIIEQPRSSKKNVSKRPTEMDVEVMATATLATAPMLVRQKFQNGRHILRGRNIQAKRAAFSDLKGLDEIFMRKR